MAVCLINMNGKIAILDGDIVQAIGAADCGEYMVNHHLLTVPLEIASNEEMDELYELFICPE